MSRYIDADELMKISFKNPIGLTAFQNIIKRQPSADVVEVVRCKDCMYYNPYDTTKAYDCERGLLGVMQDDYCSYGAREET